MGRGGWSTAFPSRTSRSLKGPRELLHDTDDHIHSEDDNDGDEGTCNLDYPCARHARECEMRCCGFDFRGTSWFESRETLFDEILDSFGSQEAAELAKRRGWVRFPVVSGLRLFLVQVLAVAARRPLTSSRARHCPLNRDRRLRPDAGRERIGVRHAAGGAA